MTFFFGDTERRIAWKDGDWYFADTQRYLGQIQQKSDGEPGSGETLTFLRKAEIDETFATPFAIGCIWLRLEWSEDLPAFLRLR